MAQVVPLERIPNQELSVRLGAQRFTLRIKEASGCMVADVSVNSVTILRATRLVAGTPVIPYQYLEAGNLIFVTENDEAPDYTRFGLDQTLVYLP